MNNLPNEIITQIFSYIDLESLYLFNILTKGYYEDIIKNLKFPIKTLLYLLTNKHITIQKLDFIKLLGSSLDDIRSNNNEILHWASRHGHLEIVKYLVSQGLTLDDIRSQRNLALHRACSYGHLEIVKYLISYRDPKDHKGLTLKDIRCNNNEALMLSSGQGHLEIVKYLVSQGLTFNDIRTIHNYTIRSYFGHLNGYYKFQY